MRPESDVWKGPAVVIGQDGPVVLVKHGGNLVRAHKIRTQLCRERSELDDDAEIVTENNINSETAQATLETVEPEYERNYETETITDRLENNTDQVQNDNHSPAPENVILEQHNEEPMSTVSEQESTSQNVSIKLKPGQKVNYKNIDGENVSATIVNRAGKATGKYKDWYNVTYTTLSNL